MPAYRKRAARARRALRRALRAHRARTSQLTDDDFADLFHLLAPARLKWQPVMARELASTLGAPPAEPVAAAAGRTAAALR